MRKNILTLYLTVFISCLNAQMNLVPNPSFEFNTQCPNTMSNITQAIGWFSAGFTPDYFHSCASATLNSLGVPCNFAGCQPAKDGNAYAGLATFGSQAPNYREYISIQLTSPLSIGTKYYASAFISRADTNSPAQNWECATNKFGFKFSTKSMSSSVSNTVLLNNFSHIKNDTVINDSLNWVPIQGSFVADSAYNYVIIGNFYNDSNTVVVNCPHVAYYYLDVVCVSSSSLSCVGFSGIQNKLNGPHFSFSPNPASTHLKVQLEDNDETILKILSTDSSERLKKVFSNNTELDISFIPNGIYFLRLQNSLGVTIEKLIISR